MTRDIQSIVEEQVKRWRIESAERRAQNQHAEQIHGNVVAISNSFGSRAARIADMVGELLHVPVYDREIVEHIAETARVRVETVDTLDERARSRLDDYLTAILHERNFDQGDFLKHLTRTVLALWAHGPCVLVGHGSVYLIARRHALAVRITAPEPDRVREIAGREHIEFGEARRQVQRVDSEREAFHRRFFHSAVADPMNYDLILNSAFYDVEGAAAVVAEAYRRKFASPVAASPAATP